MLPGFRFLLTAIILSTSMLVFGLGAAALLRAAHEQFASNPSWHAAPEATFAQQQSEPVTPVLAMLHAEPALVGLKVPDNVSALNTPAIAPPLEQATNVAAPAEPAAVSPVAAEQASVAPAASQSDRVAALKPEQTSAPEPATPAKPVVAQDPAPGLPAPAQNEAPAEASGSSTSLSQSDSTLVLTRQAAIAPVTPQANETVANEAAAETASTETAPAEGEADATAAAQSAVDAISTKLAVLDSRGVVVQPKPRPTAAIARSEQAAKKRRAAERRRIAEQTRQVMAPALFPPFPQQLNQPPGLPNH
jgi:hypothetical protein